MKQLVTNELSDVLFSAHLFPWCIIRLDEREGFWLTDGTFGVNPDAVPDILAALKLCENVIGMAQIQGKLSDNPLSPVSPVKDALIAARAALDKARSD